MAIDNETFEIEDSQEDKNTIYKNVREALDKLPNHEAMKLSGYHGYHRGLVTSHVYFVELEENDSGILAVQFGDEGKKVKNTFTIIGTEKSRKAIKKRLEEMIPKGTKLVDVWPKLIY